jgi:hypothetical protein
VTYNFIPYDPKKVIIGTQQEWFNPLMFGVNAFGTLGNMARETLEGPGLGQMDFSLVKDTPARFLGEAGSIQFRVEVFNLLNRPNFGLPNATVFPTTINFQGAGAVIPYCALGTTATATGGKCNLQGGNSIYPGSSSTTTAATPVGTVGQITNTVTSSRQIQFALKIIF